MTPQKPFVIYTRDELQPVIKAAQAAGKIVCFTSGVFDLLHRGHVEYLEEAKSKGDLLVVAVNSDSSVKQNKGDLRPVCSEGDRARIVASLRCVDFVFIFSETNNNLNIETLKPNVYVKAGDYSKSKLSSASIVESYGGKVELVSFAPGYSSSGIIDRLLDPYVAGVCEHVQMPPPEKRPAIFLDRDGTINEHVEYLGDPKKFKLIPGALDAIRKCNELGYRVVLITNQPGIGMGYFSLEDFYRVTRELLSPLGKAGGKVDKIYFCPHSSVENCSCRKPRTLMIEKAAKELNIDLSASYMIGDTTLDIELARRAGVKSILVKTGVGGADKTFSIRADHEAADLLAAAALLPVAAPCASPH